MTLTSSPFQCAAPIGAGVEAQWLRKQHSFGAFASPPRAEHTSAFAPIDR
jgi:hypothetical protein